MKDFNTWKTEWQIIIISIFNILHIANLTETHLVVLEMKHRWEDLTSEFYFNFKNIQNKLYVIKQVFLP